MLRCNQATSPNSALEAASQVRKIHVDRTHHVFATEWNLWPHWPRSGVTRTCSHALYVARQRLVQGMTGMMPRPEMNESQPKVLLVEHNANDRMILRNWLLADQCVVWEATDVTTALAACSRFRPDLILLELRLPGIDGFATIRKIKSDNELQSIPVIFLSSGATTAERVLGLDLGAVDFVSRPFDPVELQARVRAALRTRYLQRLLEERAHIDGLTGLGNRYALHERLGQVWEQGHRRGEPISLIFADLDHFKQINDLFGHAEGDEVLRRTSALLRKTVRSADFVARYGGEEFVVVAPGCNKGGAIDVAERFRVAVADLKFEFHGEPRPVTCSLGVASAQPSASLEPNDLLRKADEALYSAKNGGRNAVWAWDHSLGLATSANAFLLSSQSAAPATVVGH